MNCAALLDPYHTDGVLAFENGFPITHHRFLSDVAALAEHTSREIYGYEPR